MTGERTTRSEPGVPEFMRIQWDGLPQAVRDQTKRCLKDIIGTAAGAQALPMARSVASLVREHYGRGPAPLWFSGWRSSTVGAAFANAITVDSLDCHDGFRPNKGHAGATVVPVAVGTCAGRDVSGAELLTAITIGYEIACRAGLAIHKMRPDNYHASGSWVALGAAAAGARLQGVAPDRVDHVMGTAEYYAPVSPMLRCVAQPGAVKDGAGAGAWAAATALAMDAAAIPGLPSLFSAEACGRELARSLGNEWLILKQYFKPYPTCRWTQPVVEGALYLQRRYGFRHTDIESIEVETFDVGADLVNFPPEHSDAAQYSTPWAVAAMLVDGELGIDQVHPDRLNDPDILELGRRVKTHVAQDIQSRFPDECLARVTIVLKDGRKLSGPTLPARGDPTNPLTKDEMDAKFAALVTRSLGRRRCAELNDILETLEERPAADLLRALSWRA